MKRRLLVTSLVVAALLLALLGVMLSAGQRLKGVAV
jgi:hypothetical protein